MAFEPYSIRRNPLILKMSSNPTRANPTQIQREKQRFQDMVTARTTALGRQIWRSCHVDVLVLSALYTLLEIRGHTLAPVKLLLLLSVVNLRPTLPLPSAGVLLSRYILLLMMCWERGWLVVRCVSHQRDWRRTCPQVRWLRTAAEIQPRQQVQGLPSRSRLPTWYCVDNHFLDQSFLFQKNRFTLPTFVLAITIPVYEFRYPLYFASKTAMDSNKQQQQQQHSLRNIFTEGKKTTTNNNNRLHMIIKIMTLNYSATESVDADITTLASLSFMMTLNYLYRLTVGSVTSRISL